jgi:hypothetical protein
MSNSDSDCSCSTDATQDGTGRRRHANSTCRGRDRRRSESPRSGRRRDRPERKEFASEREIAEVQFNRLGRQIDALFHPARRRARQTRREARERLARRSNVAEMQFTLCSNCEFPFNGASNESPGYAADRELYFVCEECYHDENDKKLLRRHMRNATELAVRHGLEVMLAVHSPASLADMEAAPQDVPLTADPIAVPQAAAPPGFCLHPPCIASSPH